LLPIGEMSQYQSINVIDVMESRENGDEPFDNNLPYKDEVDAEKSLLLKPSFPKPERGSKDLRLSVYILLCTLFFGFAVGFSLGFYAFGEFACEESRESILSTTEITNKLSGDTFPQALASTASTLALIPFQTGPPRQLIYLTRADAYELLLESIPLSSSTISQYSNDFFLLLSGLDVQINQHYCGTATAVAVLNSLRYLRSSGSHEDGVDIPFDLAYAPYPYATQGDIFDECTKNTVISRTDGGVGVNGILTQPYGLNMGQIAKLLRCHLDSTADSGGGTWDIQSHLVDKTHMTLNKVKYELRNALSDPNSRLLVNYERGAIGQAGGGHWSPVGSYSEKWDAFLIVDVAKYKYPPVWVPAEKLFAAMATVDDCGSWDYPNAQQHLSTEERNQQPVKLSAAILTKLGCEKKLRGYITVKKLP